MNWPSAERWRPPVSSSSTVINPVSAFAKAQRCVPVSPQTSQSQRLSGDHAAGQGNDRLDRATLPEPVHPPVLLATWWPVTVVGKNAKLALDRTPSPSRYFVFAQKLGKVAQPDEVPPAFLGVVSRQK